MKEELWEKYADLDTIKKEQRIRKKRKRMPVSGKSVFKILNLKKTPRRNSG